MKGFFKKSFNFRDPLTAIAEIVKEKNIDSFYFEKKEKEGAEAK